jgi:hypothetical protein
MSKHKKREWTIMVYLAGDNNLSVECVFALNEMKRVAGLENFHLAVQFDPSDPFLPTHRYLIQENLAQLWSDITDQARFNPRTGEVHFSHESKHADEFAKIRLRQRERASHVSENTRRASLGTAPDPTDGSNDDTDTASPITLYNFLSFCIDEYPADHYIAVVCGHGAGTQRDYLLRDTSPAGYLTLPELSQVFKQLLSDRKKPIEILGLDSCLMSMAEVCYELRGAVEILVGSEGFSPASGWPFRMVLQRLRDILHTATNKELQNDFATAIVEEYTNYYTNYWLGGLSVAQSAMDLRQVEQLKRAIDALAARLAGALERDEPLLRDALVLAHWEAQSYNGERFVDLYDFCDCLEKRSNDDHIQSECRGVKAAIGKFVLKSCYNGPAYQYSHGVSIYFPWAQVANSYRNLDLVRRPDSTELRGWGRFLEIYTAKTRRRPRDIEAAPGLAREADAIPQGSATIRTLVRKTTDMKTTDMKTTDMGSGNDTLSMRNPPVVFVPDICVREGKGILEAERKLLGPAEVANFPREPKTGRSRRGAGKKRKGR